MEFSLKDLASQDAYKLITGSIVPRPIAWVSTVSEAGINNVAPFSYFNAVSANPPMIMFSSGQKDASTPKDTIRNIETSKEFVVNIVTMKTVEAMNASAINAPHGISEFELSGVTPSKSKTIKAPRVLESPINFECKLADFYQVGGNTVVFGEILHIHIHDDVYLDNYKINTQTLSPVGRLAGTQYAPIKDIFSLERPVYKEAE